MLFRSYGFSAKKDLLAQILALNQQVAAKIEKGEPVISPGVPKNYPDAKKLVTKDCIQPVGAEPPSDTIAQGESTTESEAAAAHFYSIHEKPAPYRIK